MAKKLNIVVAGLGFGSSFAPIYRDHPDVGCIGIFDPDEEAARRISARDGIDRVYSDFSDVLADRSVDAVHLVTPIPLHADQTVAVLESGKHCACTVPMATSLRDIKRISDAKKSSGKLYMMMETTLYTYQLFYVKQMIACGALGRIQFMRGSHYQDMANWPDYWLGLPPMWYGTHALAPMIELSGSRVKRVVCFGSGSMDESLSKRYGNPFPVESALLEFENGMKGEATRSLFETAREYQEGLSVYGTKSSFEWGFRDGDDPIVTSLSPAVPGERGGRTSSSAVHMPNHFQSLPEPVRKYTISAADFDPLNPQKSLETGAGSGHHGSHPHLVNEFVRSILDGRAPHVDEVLGGNITGTGICAHESAMRGGASVEVPLF